MNKPIGKAAIILALFAAALAGTAWSATIDVTTRGVRNDGVGCQSEALRKLVREAAPETVLLFPKGVYHLDREVLVTGKTNLVFRGMPGATVELMFDPVAAPWQNACGIVARNCAGIIVEGLRFTTDIPPNCAGRVTAKDEQARTFDVALENEFPCTGKEHFWGIDTCDDEGMPDYVIETYEKIVESEEDDGKGGKRKTFTGTRYEKIGDHLIRVQMPRHWNLSRLRIGHRILFRYIIYGRSVLDFVGCDDTVVRNVRVDRCASMGVTVGPPSRNFTLDGFDMLLPEGSAALYVANADGVHLYGLSGKLEMRNCHFKGLGDDALNIHCGAGEVKRFDPATGEIVCINRNRERKESKLGRTWAKAGDELIVYDGLTMLTKGRAKLTAYDPDTGVGRVAPGAPAIAVGDNLANAAHFPSVHVANCSFENSRARGILLQSHNMLVEECFFRGHALPGIIIAADYRYWNEAGPTVNTEVRNCRFEKCGMNGSPANLGAVQVKTSHDHVLTPHPAGVHRDVRIIHNQFDGCGNSGVFVQSTDGVKILDNRFTHGSARRYDVKDDANLYDIRLFNCTNVLLRGNSTDKAADRLLLETNEHLQLTR